MQHLCPFCHGAIDETLSLHGGTCPQCFGEIPGEETATDPGEEIKARETAAMQAHARRRSTMPLIVATPVILAIAVFSTWYALAPEPEVEELVFDDGFVFEIGLEEYREPEDAPAEADATPATAGTPRQARTGGGGGAPLTAPSGVGELSQRLAGAQASDGIDARRARGGGAAPTPGGVRDIGGLSATAGGGSVEDDLDLGFGAKRTAALLESRDDIQNAVRDMFRARSPRLQQCYERSLKAREDLGGQWRVSFTIDTSGTVTGASATGLTMKDDAFEACLVREMSTWSIYGRLVKPWPVSLPLKFKSD